MKIVGVYNLNGKMYCYRDIILKNYGKPKIILCNEKNTTKTINKFNYKNATYGYILKDNGELENLAPMNYLDFHFLLAFSGVLFGAFLFFIISLIFINFKK